MFKYVLSREGTEKGTIIKEHSRRCQLEGCTSYKASVRWSNGKITYPCWKGLKVINEDTVQIM